MFVAPAPAGPGYRMTERQARRHPAAPSGPSQAWVRQTDPVCGPDAPNPPPSYLARILPHRMSDLPAAALDYQAVVAEYFLRLRGSALMLSPLDQDLVVEWERRGLPVAVVCRGLRRGLEDLAERRAGPPRSIRALRLAVEDEWRGYRDARVGDAPAPPVETAAADERLARARELMSGAERGADGRERDGYRAASRALAAADAHPGTPLERVEAALAQADERILAAWLAGLPPARRRSLGPRIRLLAGPRRPGESRHGYREALRAHLADSARAAGLTCLRGSV